MVSPVSTPSRRFCPVLGSSLPVQRCVGERIVTLNCPITCQFNPFNPDAPKAFDAIVGRGLAGASRWLEKTVGIEEWTRRFDAMDRRFMPERDLPLISYETQWSLLRMAKDGLAYPKVAAGLDEKDGHGLKNDARLVFEKLLQSRAMLVQVTRANDALPYYEVRNVFDESEELLYVDFGDQEPLEAGALMFGRFLVHENCIYVIPGVFVGTSDVLGLLLDAILEFLDEPFEKAEVAMQGALPEIWNLCTSVQDERDSLENGENPDSYSEVAVDPYRESLSLEIDKSDAVLLLAAHPLFTEVDAPEFGYDPLGETVFDIFVQPSSPPMAPTLEGEQDEEYDDETEEDESNIRVGSVAVAADRLVIAAANPVELELLKALTLQILADGDTL